MTRVRILFNPRAGGLRGARVAGELARELCALGLECDDGLPTDEVGFASVRAGAQDVVVVLGGDGTFHDALNLLDADVLRSSALAFLGLGTVNVLALAGELPREPAALARLIAAGHTIRVPVACAGARRFLLFLEAGFMAAAIVRANAWSAHAATRWLLAGGLLRRPRKKALIGLAGLVSALTAFGRPLTVEGLGAARGLCFSDVLLTRVREYGGRLHLPVEVALDEARFEVLGFRSRWPGTHLFLFGLLALGLVERWAGWLERRGLLFRGRADGLRLASRGRPACFADAETLEATMPLELAFEPDLAVRLIVPAGWTPHRTAGTRG